MTNERASKIIYQEWQSFLEKYVDFAGVSDAYQMAIKALEKLDDIEKLIENYGITGNENELSDFEREIIEVIRSGEK